MKKLTGLFLLITLILTFSSNQLRADEKSKALLGEWLYEVNEAPYGYDKGSLVFAEKDGQITCVIILEAGELPTNDLTVENEKITFTTSVEGSTINIVLTLENEKLSGLVDSPEGPKKITATRK